MDRDVIYSALDTAFKQSSYLHSVGSGNVQAVEHIVAKANAFGEDAYDLVVGYVLGAALVDIEDAHYAAEQILS